MKLKDTWEIEDVVSGLKLKVIPGTKQDHLHVESLTGGTKDDDHPKMNRDFWFTKDGDFDGTGSVVSEMPSAPHAESFEEELTQLINRHSIENVVDMPDFLLAGMICCMIEAMGPSIKKTLDWHGCDSVCHPAPNARLHGREGSASE